MNFKFIIAVIAFLLTSNLVKGQNQSDNYAFTSIPVQNDSLIIERQDGQKIKLIWPFNKNVKKKVAWEQLLNDFQSDFKKVVADIPSYDFYRISYIQKKNLVVDELTGKEIYTVNEIDGVNYVKSNICELQGNKIKISIEFNDAKELLDPSIKTEIESAITLIKNKFYTSMITPERHYYSVNSANMLPNPKRKYKFFIPMGARVGVLKNQPYVELRPGLGLKIDKQHYIALNWNVMTQYNDLSDKTEFDNYVGLTIGTLGQGFGSEVAFKVKSGIEDNEDIYFKAGVNYRTKSGIQIGAEYYNRKPQETRNDVDFLFGFNLGIGF